jgi:hypothetical protein
MHTKMHTNGGLCSPRLAIAGFVKEGFWVRVPLLAPRYKAEDEKMNYTCLSDFDLVENRYFRT